MTSSDTSGAQGGEQQDGSSGRDEYLEELYSKLETQKRPLTVDKERVMYIKHPWHGIPIGKNAPDVVPAIVEVPAHNRLKTELDKATGLIKADRILHSSVVYPANYGFIPGTLAEDNDPLDVLVLCQLSVPHFSLMQVRPIGVMPMIEQGMPDDKIISVVTKDPEYNIYYDISELPPYKLLMINQFFNDYITLEQKEVRTFKPMGAGHAKRIIEQCARRYKEHFGIKS